MDFELLDSKELRSVRLPDIAVATKLMFIKHWHLLYNEIIKTEISSDHPLLMGEKTDLQSNGKQAERIELSV